jgi:hypothetical protein
LLNFIIQPTSGKDGFKYDEEFEPTGGDEFEGDEKLSEVSK